METSNQLILNPPLDFPQPTTLSKFLEENDEEASTTSDKLSLQSKRISKKRDKYQRIDDSVRQKLIDAVIKEGQMLKSVKPFIFLNPLTLYRPLKSLILTILLLNLFFIPIEKKVGLTKKLLENAISENTLKIKRSLKIHTLVTLTQKVPQSLIIHLNSYYLTLLNLIFKSL